MIIFRVVNKAVPHITFVKIHIKVYYNLKDHNLCSGRAEVLQ